MRVLRRIGWSLALLAVAVMTVKSFVGDVFRISSPSMEPSLCTGEWVWVRFDSSPPERGEIVVLDKRGELLVKRTMGLGGESVKIEGGDVRIDGEPLDPVETRGEPVVLFDQRTTPLEERFAHGSSQLDPWTASADRTWELDAREVERNSQAGLLRYIPDVVDGWPELATQGTRMAERRDVGDVLLEFEVQVLEASGRLRAVLVERGDRFTLSIELGEEDAGKVEFLRRDPGGLSVLATMQVELEVGEWVSIAFANVDDHLTARIGGEVLPPVPTGLNSFHPADHGRLGLSYGNRAMLGGEQCRLRVRAVRVARDLHYESIGEFGVERELVLGADQLFLLGDNSPASRDSRTWGAVGLGDVLGRASWVVWPPSAWRRVDRRATGRPEER